MDDNEYVLASFLSWKDELYSEVRGSTLMFDVPHYYKWLKEDELFNYFLQKDGEKK